jgi:tripeptide aminopeptidase
MSIKDLFIQFAETPSPSGKEKQISDLLVIWIRENLKIEPYQDNSYNIHFSFVPTPKYCFCAHMDTVQPAEGIKVQEQDDYLTSSGNSILGADNKASLSAILYSLKSLIEDGVTPDCEVLLTVREETDGGIKDFDLTKLKSKLVYIFDKGGDGLDCVVTQAGTIYDFEAEIIGRSAHASRPEEGVNSLLIIQDFLNHVTLGRPDQSTTFNIGTLNGGVGTNTSIGELRFSGDLRSFEKNKFKQYKDKIDNAFNNAISKYFTRGKII